jgi:hypothetical protein
MKLSRVVVSTATYQQLTRKASSIKYLMTFGNAVVVEGTRVST